MTVVRSAAVQIRPAVEVDAAAMAQAHYSAVHVRAASTYPTEVLDIWSPAPSEARNEVFRNAMQKGRELFLVAEEAAAVIGFGSIVPDSNELRSVYVKSDAGRRGVGSAILRALEALAASRGCPELQFDASLNAEPFYARNGYIAGARGAHRLSGGWEMACVRMRKRL
jgi:putative acetyltransferase